MKSKKLVLAVALVAILVAGYILWRQFSAPAVNFRPSAAAGEVLADEVSRLLGGSGEVLIIARQTSREGTDAMGQRVASFAAALGRGTKLQLTATEWIPRAAGGMMDLGGVSQEQLETALEKNSTVNLAVVFAGLPPYSPGLAEKLTARSQKLVAVCGYGPTVRSWLDAKALELAVVPRLGDPPATTAAPKTAKEWFEREFQIVTPANVGQMPY